MREAMAVTGYLAVEAVDGIKSAGQIDIFPERDVRDVRMRVAGADIEDVRIGGTEGGLTLVQLILRDGVAVETIIQATADPSGMRAYHDPVLNRIRQEATAKKIML